MAVESATKATAKTPESCHGVPLQGRLMEIPEKLAWKYGKACSDHEEMAGVCGLAFARALSLFDPAKSPNWYRLDDAEKSRELSGFLFQRCEWELRNWLWPRAGSAKAKDRRGVNLSGLYRDELEGPLAEDKRPCPLKAIDDRDLAEVALASLEPREALVITKRAEGMTLAAVGKLLGLARSSVQAVEKLAQARARRLFREVLCG